MSLFMRSRASEKWHKHSFFHCLLTEVGKSGQMDPYYLLSWCIYHINMWTSLECCLVFEWFRQRLLRFCLPWVRYETAVMFLDFCNIVNIIKLHTIHCSNLILQGCCFWHSVKNMVFPSVQLKFKHLFLPPEWFSCIFLWRNFFLKISSHKKENPQNISCCMYVQRLLCSEAEA